MVRVRLKDNPARHSSLMDADSILIPPAPYLDAVRRSLGCIDLDPCSSPKAQVAIAAAGWFRADQAEAALAAEWRGRVFLHPHPNSRLARLQVQKLLRDYLADRVTAAIILSSRMDLLRQEPLLLSFPFLVHYRRLQHWQWNSQLMALQRHNPSWNAVTHYLCAKDGSHFDDTQLAVFHHAFRDFGRLLVAEDYDGDDWQEQALAASRTMRTAPVLTAARLQRHNSELPYSPIDAQLQQ